MNTLELFNDDCLKALKLIESESIDSLVTDPPAGISFMGKDWDHNKGGRDQWVAWMTEVMAECLRVLKPGAHGLVWALPRTSHWTATALENAGFEVRDVVTHLFGTGFPKSLDISKAIDKTAGAEREVVGVKPKTRADNPASGSPKGGRSSGEIFDNPMNDMPLTAPATSEAKQWQGWGTALKPASEHWILVRKPCSEKTVAANVLKHGTGGINIDGCRVGLSGNERQPAAGGRFPANLVLDEVAAEMLDEQSGVSSGSGKRVIKKQNSMGFQGGDTPYDDFSYADSGGASRFFYVAKASKTDRGEANNHPTVKSTKLMEYLVKLVTAPGGTVLDPFMGSGSTGIAALQNNFGFIGIEKEAEYFEIAGKRIVKVLEGESDDKE